MNKKNVPVGQLITAVIALALLAVLVVPHLLRKKNEQVVRLQMQVISGLMGETKSYPLNLSIKIPKTEFEQKLMEAIQRIRARGYEVDYAAHPSGQSFLMKARPRKVGTDGAIVFQLDQDGIVSEVRVGKETKNSSEGMFVLMRE